MSCGRKKRAFDPPSCARRLMGPGSGVVWEGKGRGSREWEVEPGCMAALPAAKSVRSGTSARECVCFHQRNPSLVFDPRVICIQTQCVGLDIRCGVCI